MEIKLPKLPEPADRDQRPTPWSLLQMAEYARAAVEADRIDRVATLMESLTKLVVENASLNARLNQKHDAAQWTKVPFVVGQVYETRGGGRVLVQCLKDDMPGYECVEGNDHIHRYARPHDQGRTTGTDGTCEHDLMPLYRRNDNAV